MGKVRTAQELNDAAEIGLKISRLRVSRHMTQEELADSIGLDRITIHRMESGRRIPDAATIIKLSDAFSVSPGEFFPVRFAQSTTQTTISQSSPGKNVLDELTRLIERMTEPDKNLFCTFIMKAANGFIHESVV